MSETSSQVHSYGFSLEPVWICVRDLSRTQSTNAGPERAEFGCSIAVRLCNSCAKAFWPGIGGIVATKFLYLGANKRMKSEFRLFSCFEGHVNLLRQRNFFTAQNAEIE